MSGWSSRTAARSSLPIRYEPPAQAAARGARPPWAGCPDSAGTLTVTKFPTRSASLKTSPGAIGACRTALPRTMTWPAGATDSTAQPPPGADTTLACTGARKGAAMATSASAVAPRVTPPDGTVSTRRSRPQASSSRSGPPRAGSGGTGGGGAGGAGRGPAAYACWAGGASVCRGDATGGGATAAGGATATGGTRRDGRRGRSCRGCRGCRYGHRPLAAEADPVPQPESRAAPLAAPSVAHVFTLNRAPGIKSCSPGNGGHIHTMRRAGMPIM